MLLNAATAYMNLLRDTAILNLQKSNVDVLQEQLRQTRDRFNVGRGDAHRRGAGGISGCKARSQVAAAEANLQAPASPPIAR